MPGVAEFVSGGSVFNGPFARLLVQLLLITLASRALGKAFQYIKEPMVISEIVAGILLGPTVLGNWDWFHNNFFPSSSLALLSAVANFGLVLFMFLIDMKLLRPRWKVSVATAFTVSSVPFSCILDVTFESSLLRRRSSFPNASNYAFFVVDLFLRLPLRVFLEFISFPSGTAVCFAVTVPLALMIRHFDCPDGGKRDGCAADLLSGFLAFYMFLGVIVSISALPVLARILTDFRILTTNLGTLTIATTTVEDFIAWPLLAISLAVAGATEKITILWLFLLLIGDILFVALVVRPLLVLIVKYYSRRDSISQMGLYLVMSLLLLVSFYAEIIGLSAFIGAFQVGLVMPRRGNIIGQISSKIEDISVVLFLPLFFASSGQKTDLKAIDTGHLWLITICIVLTSCCGKFLGCVPPAKLLAGFSWRESFTFGALMNTKGLVALVSLNLGLSYGIITGKLFSMCVLMVIINTLLTCPLVWVLNRGFFRERRENERQQALDIAAERRLKKRTAMICLQPTVLSETLSLGRMLFTPETSWVFLRLIENADRPSMYMGPLGKKLLKRDQTLRSALEFTKLADIPTPDVVCDMNANYYTGISIAAAERDPHYVYLGVDRRTATSDQLLRDLHPLMQKNLYTLLVLIDHSRSLAKERSGEQVVPHALSHHSNSLSLLRERLSVVFPYVGGADSEEALTFAITLSSRGLPVEVIQTAERSGAETNEVLRRLFSGQSVTYRLHSDDWRTALGDSQDRGRLVLLPFSRNTVEYAVSSATSPVVLIKAPHRESSDGAPSARSTGSHSSMQREQV